MCGRHGTRSDKQKIAEAFHVKSSLTDIDLYLLETFRPVV